jgi:predicted TIM-barrel fold metal-dependent hydrolase
LTEPMGRRRFWPIYEAAARHNLPIGVHGGGYGGHSVTGGGWPRYYVEEHPSTAQSAQALITSLVFEGVLERYPTSRFIVVESGFAWVPSMKWRMDKHWQRLKSEVPHVKRLPSEQVHDHFWFTTQPVDEPETIADMAELFEWIGWDRVLYSSDYPHWDFDDPRYAFKTPLSEQERAKLFNANARAVYRLD